MAVKTLTPTPEVRDVLLQADVWQDGADWKLRIHQQLDRGLYTSVNKFLEALGGKWNRSAKAHVFSTNPLDGLRQVAAGETLVVDNQDFFPTPDAVAEQMVSLISQDIGPATRILEPSAGTGALVSMLESFLGGDLDPQQVTCVEINEQRAAQLKKAGYNVYTEDFLSFFPGALFDLILMNPPFSNQADIYHVRYAFDCLVPGGELIAIMSEGTFFRTDRTATTFREDYIERYCTDVIPLHNQEFKSSGTGVNSRIVRLVKH